MIATTLRQLVCLSAVAFVTVALPASAARAADASPWDADARAGMRLIAGSQARDGDARLADRIEEAITTLQKAADIFREIKNRHGEGMALNSLGNALRKAKRIEQAITTLREATAIFRETGDNDSERKALIICQELVAAQAA